MPYILIADDEVGIAQLISDSLIDEGFETKIVTSGDKAFDIMMKDSEISLAILDIMMPGLDGISVCRKVREIFAGPIIFVTAKNRTIDTLLGLEIGADDYITKPFIVEELVAKIKAHMRREDRNKKPSLKTMKFAELEISPETFEVKKAGKQIALSTREFQLLEYLCKNCSRVLSHEQIFLAVWGSEYGDIGTVKVHIKNLRDKLDSDSRFIKTIWGIGYKFVVPDDSFIQQDKAES